MVILFVVCHLLCFILFVICYLLIVIWYSLIVFPALRHSKLDGKYFIFTLVPVNSLCFDQKIKIKSKIKN